MRNAGAVEALGPELRHVYEALRALMFGPTRDDSRTRRQVGAHVASVKRSQDKHGARAVERLAAALGTNVHSLYRAAAVAECWSPAQFDILAARTTAHGRPLSWSHLVLISGVTSPRARGELVERALRDALSVRELTALLDAQGRSSGTANAVLVLDRLVRATERWAQTAAEMSDELLEELDFASYEDGDPKELIEKAIAAQEQLQGTVRRQLERLRAQRGRLRDERDTARPAGARLLAGFRA